MYLRLVDSSSQLTRCTVHILLCYSLCLPLASEDIPISQFILIFSSAAHLSINLNTYIPNGYTLHVLFQIRLCNFAKHFHQIHTIHREKSLIMPFGLCVHSPPATLFSPQKSNGFRYGNRAHKTINEMCVTQ